MKNKNKKNFWVYLRICIIIFIKGIHIKKILRKIFIISVFFAHCAQGTERSAACNSTKTSFGACAGFFYAGPDALLQKIVEYPCVSAVAAIILAGCGGYGLRCWQDSSKHSSTQKETIAVPISIPKNDVALQVETLKVQLAARIKERDSALARASIAEFGMDLAIGQRDAAINHMRATESGMDIVIGQRDAICAREAAAKNELAMMLGGKDAAQELLAAVARATSLQAEIAHALDERDRAQAHAAVLESEMRVVKQERDNAHVSLCELAQLLHVAAGNNGLIRHLEHEKICFKSLHHDAKEYVEQIVGALHAAYRVQAELHQVALDFKDVVKDVAEVAGVPADAKELDMIAHAHYKDLKEIAREHLIAICAQKRGASAYAQEALGAARAPSRRPSTSILA